MTKLFIVEYDLRHKRYVQVFREENEQELRKILEDEGVDEIWQVIPVKDLNAGMEITHFPI